LTLLKSSDLSSTFDTIAYSFEYIRNKYADLLIQVNQSSLTVDFVYE